MTTSSVRFIPRVSGGQEIDEDSSFGDLMTLRTKSKKRTQDEERIMDAAAQMLKQSGVTGRAYAKALSDVDSHLSSFKGLSDAAFAQEFQYLLVASDPRTFQGLEPAIAQELAFNGASQLRSIVGDALILPKVDPMKRVKRFVNELEVDTTVKENVTSWLTDEFGRYDAQDHDALAEMLLEGGLAGIVQRENQSVMGKAFDKTFDEFLSRWELMAKTFGFQIDADELALAKAELMDYKDTAREGYFSWWDDQLTESATGGSSTSAIMTRLRVQGSALYLQDSFGSIINSAMPGMPRDTQRYGRDATNQMVSLSFDRLRAVSSAKSEVKTLADKLDVESLKTNIYSQTEREAFADAASDLLRYANGIADEYATVGAPAGVSARNYVNETAGFVMAKALGPTRFGVSLNPQDAVGSINAIQQTTGAETEAKAEAKRTEQEVVKAEGRDTVSKLEAILQSNRYTPEQKARAQRELDIARRQAISGARATGEVTAQGQPAQGVPGAPAQGQPAAPAPSAPPAAGQEAGSVLDEEGVADLPPGSVEGFAAIQADTARTGQGLPGFVDAQGRYFPPPTDARSFATYVQRFGSVQGALDWFYGNNPALTQSAAPVPEPPPPPKPKTPPAIEQPPGAAGPGATSQPGTSAALPGSIGAPAGPVELQPGAPGFEESLLKPPSGGLTPEQQAEEERRKRRKREEEERLLASGQGIP